MEKVMIQHPFRDLETEIVLPEDFSRVLSGNVLEGDLFLIGGIKNAWLIPPMFSSVAEGLVDKEMPRFSLIVRKKNGS